MARLTISVTHQAPGFKEVKIGSHWTLDTANSYVDTIEAVTGTYVRIYIDNTVVRTKVCDSRQ